MSNLREVFRCGVKHPEIGYMNIRAGVSFPFWHVHQSTRGLVHACMYGSGSQSGTRKVGLFRGDKPEHNQMLTPYPDLMI